MVAKRARRRVQEEAIEQTQIAYDNACIVAYFLEMNDPRLRGRVICERCGLEQPYLTADDFERDELDLYPCEGWLEIGCGSEIAITHEAYADAA